MNVEEYQIKRKPHKSSYYLVYIQLLWQIVINVEQFLQMLKVNVHVNDKLINAISFVS